MPDQETDRQQAPESPRQFFVLHWPDDPQSEQQADLLGGLIEALTGQDQPARKAA